MLETTLEQVTQLRNVFQNFVSTLVQIRDLWDSHTQVLNDPASASVEFFAEYFGVRLETDGMTDAQWENARLSNVYNAITSIARAIANAMFEGELLFGAMQFSQSLGGLTLILTAGFYTDQEGNEYRDVGAVTSSDGLTINLYVRNSSQAHSSLNIIHEIGHSLSFRTGGEMYNQWERVRLTFSRLVTKRVTIEGSERDVSVTSFLDGFRVDEGWSNLRLRQNRFDASRFASCQNLLVQLSDEQWVENICQELEEERLADMFLAWAYGDPFDNQERGNAMRSFVQGDEFTRQQTTFQFTGILGWIHLIT